MLTARLTPAPLACPTKMQLPAMPSPRPSPDASRSPPFQAPVAGSLTDGTVITQCRCSKFRNRWSRSSSAAAPARASSSDENGSTRPWRLTRTDGIWPIGVSSVLGWQPAGSLERSRHCAA